VSSTSRLSLFDVLCLGVNAIVGSGIYMFPGNLAALLGPASFLAFGLAGLIAALIGLCFAEAAGMFERSGGPYVYAESAFGSAVGYWIGWTCWVAALFSWAAVASGIAPYLGQLWPAVASGAPAKLLALVIIGSLSVVNLYGARPGAIATDIMTVVKLLPLGVLVVMGLVRGPRRPSGAFAPHGLRPLPRAAFTTFFAFQGFEVVPVPAGETANPRRNAPLAVLGSLVGSTVLYMLVQWVAVTTTPSLAGSKQPLAAMGSALLGGAGSQMVSAAAVISMLGFCTGVALAGPRYVEALALGGHLTPLVARRHARSGAPQVAILLTAGATALLTLLLDFSRLVDISVLTVSVQYLATCAALPVLRWRRRDLPRSFRLPFGPVVPALACAVTVWLAAKGLATKEGPRELAMFALVAAAGVVLELPAWWRRRKPAVSNSPGR